MAFQESPGRPFRATSVSDMFDTGHATADIVLLQAKLIAGSGAAATAQLVDADGTVLGDFAAPAGGEGYIQCAVFARGKIRLGTIAGAGAIMNIWVL